MSKTSVGIALWAVVLLACSSTGVSVISSFAADDHVEEIARLVHGALTKSNAPL